MRQPVVAIRLEAPTLAKRVLDQRERSVAAGGAAHLVCKQLGRDGLEAADDVLRRPAPAFGQGQDRLGVGGRDLRLIDHGRLEAEQVPVRVVASGPAAGRRERHDRPRPAGSGELQRHVAAER
jgi:hypothetical protein